MGRWADDGTWILTDPWEHILSAVDSACGEFDGDGLRARDHLIHELLKTIEIYWPGLPGSSRGQIPGWMRREVLERDAYRCVSCEGWTRLCVDHVIPVAKGGPTTLANLQTLCHSCNSRKGGRFMVADGGRVE